MTKKQQASFDRFWTRMVNGGIPLSDGFEISVVKAHAELAFESGYRLAKNEQKEKEKQNDLGFRYG